MHKRNDGRPGYKKSKVGWIPEEWEIRDLLHVADYVDYRGKTPTKSEAGVFLLTAKNIQMGYIDYESSKEYIPESSYENVMSRGTPEIGDIVITTEAPLGNVAQIDNCNIAIAQRVIKYRTKLNILISDYFKYYLLSPMFQRILSFNSTGSTVKGIKGSRLHKLPAILPPLAEQKKIAEILSAWDRAIEQTRNLIDAKQRLKKGLMQQLLTGRMQFPEFGKPVKKKNQDYRETKLGFLPNDWDVKSLGMIGSFSKGRGISNSEKMESGLPCITYGEIYTKYDFVINEFKSFINDITAQESQRIYNNDILFAGSGETLDDIGKCVAYNQDKVAYAGGDIIIHRPKNVNSTYLSYSLNSGFIVRYRRKLGQGHSVVHIYSSGLNSLLIPIPPLPEQKRIAQILTTCDNQINILQQKEALLLQQKKGLMQKLLTGEVRVKA